jgi:hypothetical protein
MEKENNTTLDQYIKHKNGLMFQIMQHYKIRGKCYLRRGNKYTLKDLTEIKQGIQSGTWNQPNEHEIKNFIKEDNKKTLLITQKIVNRTLHAQALLEIDDSLKEDLEDDNRMVAVLNRSNKEIERIADKMYDRIYDKDDTVSQNLLDVVSRIGKIIGGIDVIDMPFLENHLDRFLENIEEHRKETVYFKNIG